MPRGAEVLIIGDAPGPNTDGARPLYPHTATSSAGRLMAMMDLSLEEYLETRRINANHDGHRPLPRDEARRRVQSISGRAGFKLVILLGRDAANQHPAGRTMRPGEVREWRDRRVLMIPHTSGKNRYWNDPANREAMEAILRQELARDS